MPLGVELAWCGTRGTAVDFDRNQNAVRFGPFEVDFSAHELRKRGTKVKLRDKSFEVLALLLDRPSELVTREELRARLWPADVFVDFENNLNTAVARLRQALGDSAETPRYVETLPRHGYRFVAPVVRQEAGARQVKPEPIRVAVLPFDNLSGDPDQEYFSDGMTEELITELASVAPDRLGVIARTSALRYKHSRKQLVQIGRELDVDYIVEGSVRRTDNRVRISAQLIKIQDQMHVWAQSYDSNLSDVLGLQREVARAITGQIDVKLSQRAVRARDWRSISPETYDSYLLGLHHFSRASPGSFEKADQYFRQVTATDPLFAPAYAKQAMGYVLSAFFGYAPHNVAFPRAESAARTALDIDQSLAEAHSALAIVHWFHNWDLAACQRELECALRLNPSDSTAHWSSAMFLGSMKEEHERAALEARLASSFDPLSVAIQSMTCWLPYWARQYDRAIAQAHAVIEIDSDAPQAFYVLGAAARAKGAHEDSIAALEQAVATFGDPFSLAYLGMSCGLAGKRDRTRDVFAQLGQTCSPHPVPPILHAFIYAGLGENSKAIECIETAFDHHDALVLWLRVSPDWDVLRGEPGFRRLIRRLDCRLPKIAY